MIETDWRPKLMALVAALTDSGQLRSQAWMDAFSAIPRHVFTPEIILGPAEGYRRISGEDPVDRAEWLSLVYSDDSLVVQDMAHAAGYTLPSGQPVRIPTSSSTMPSLMAQMLEVLDVHSGMRVLEVGTGTGYNAAVLAHRLGDDHVVSIDIDPTLISHASQRLAKLGYQPVLVGGDGTEGVAAHGPYDRIIATAAVPEIPQAWIDQLAPGGKVLCNLRGELAGGTLCLLTKHGSDNEVIGPVLPIGGHFMWLRPDLIDPHRPHEHTSPVKRPAATRTTTSHDPAGVPIAADGFRFLLQLQVRGVGSLYTGSAVDPETQEECHAVIVTSSDGSRAEVFHDLKADAGRYRVVQSGPRRLWDSVVATHLLFDELGRPTPELFGVVANSSTQFVWFRDDDSWYRWPLPLA